MTEIKDQPLLTRAQIIECVREELGIPICESTVKKAGMKGGGLRPAAKYGKALLYTKPAALAWARTLITVAATDERDNPKQKNAPAIAAAPVPPRVTAEIDAMDPLDLERALTRGRKTIA